MGRGAPSLTREKWADAALDALAAGGLGAVAVEPLARTLGVTKGSFYHHFASREALLQAALERWESLETDDVLQRVEPFGPLERLEYLFESAAAGDIAPRWAVLVQLVAHRNEPLVSEVLARVTERRLAYLTETWRSAGLDPEEAERRALLAYSSYLGMLQLAVSAPGCVPHGEASLRYMERVREMLVPRPAPMREDAAARRSAAKGQ